MEAEVPPELPDVMGEKGAHALQALLKLASAEPVQEGPDVVGTAAGEHLLDIQVKRRRIRQIERHPILQKPK
jgi:hypothetical protein